MLENFGLILSKPKPNDWLAGDFTPLKKRVLNISGDWTAYLPIVETQNANGFDTMACVTYSILNCLEILYLFFNKVNRDFSDRFIAKMSGTSTQGNTLENVFDTIRHYGLVDENVYPNQANNWDEYYQAIPQDIINKGKEFLINWAVYREWVNPYDKEALFLSLKHAPLQVVVKYANGNGILKPEGNYNHAVCLFNAVNGKYWEVFDHYTQSIKKYAWEYNFGGVLLPTLSYKISNNMFIPKDNELYLLVEGAEQKLAMGLDGKLVIYDQKIDTLLNSASRSKKYQIPTPITLEMYNSVEKVNGKGEPLS